MNLNKGGLVIALDLLDMDPIVGAKLLKLDFINGDKNILLKALEGRDNIDVVLSDMAPNTSGNRNIDHNRSLELNEAALEFALKWLKKDNNNNNNNVNNINNVINNKENNSNNSSNSNSNNSVFLTKLFQGEGEIEFKKKLHKHFKSVSIIKPEASRQHSYEVYYLARCIK